MTCRCSSTSPNRKGCCSFHKRPCALSRSDPVPSSIHNSLRILKQLVGFRQLFDFWVRLAEDLWKNKHKLIPSAGSPEETSTYTAALNRTIDSLIGAAIPEYNLRVTRNPFHTLTLASTDLRDHTFNRLLQLLDLMALTHRTNHTGPLITSAAEPKDNLLLEYQQFITPLVPQLKARYRKYSSSLFPILDALLRAFVERWLQDLLGTPSTRPRAIAKKLACQCQDCAKINKFLNSDAVTETLWAAQKRRSHVQDNIRSSIPDAVTYTTIKGGSPHGLQVTKTHVTSTMDKWDGRVASARAFLSLVGTPNVLVRIMGDRYQDVQAALAGTKPYKIKKPVPVVENPPVASTSSEPGPSGPQAAPVMAGKKRKAEDDCGDVIDLTSD